MFLYTCAQLLLNIIKRPPTFGGGMKLTWEKHEQGEYETQHLLVAQLKFNCQLEHLDKSLVLAGRPANC